MKKLLAFLMAIMVFATMAAGCGGGSDKRTKKNRLRKNSLILLLAVQLVHISHWEALSLTF